MCLVTTGDTILLKSYFPEQSADNHSGVERDPMVWEAARATTAAEDFFREIEIDHEVFFDPILDDFWGSGINNPVSLI